MTKDVASPGLAFSNGKEYAPSSSSEKLSIVKLPVAQSSLASPI